MALCRKCGKGGLIWGQVLGKWRLHSGSKLHSCLEPQTPEMGRRRSKQKDVDKDFESRKMKLIGFRFNNSNLEDGLLDSLLSGEYQKDE